MGERVAIVFGQGYVFLLALFSQSSPVVDGKDTSKRYPRRPNNISGENLVNHKLSGLCFVSYPNKGNKEPRAAKLP